MLPLEEELPEPEALALVLPEAVALETVALLAVLVLVPVEAELPSEPHPTSPAAIVAASVTAMIFLICIFFLLV